jgi:hypothetical protein
VCYNRVLSRRENCVIIVFYHGITTSIMSRLRYRLWRSVGRIPARAREQPEREADHSSCFKLKLRLMAWCVTTFALPFTDPTELSGSGQVDSSLLSQKLPTCILPICS